MNARKLGAAAPSLALLLAVAMVAACGGDDSDGTPVDGGSAGSSDTGGHPGTGGSAGSSATGGHAGTAGSGGAGGGNGGAGGNGGTGGGSAGTGGGGNSTPDASTDAKLDSATDAKADTSSDGSTEASSDAKVEASADASTDGGYTDAAGPTSCTTDAGGYTDGGDLIVPTVPAGLEPPVGSMLVARYHAEGWQIYTCTATVVDAGADAGTTYSWVFKAPSATLYDKSCAVAGTHFAGPTWQSTDGSTVAGAVRNSATSPNASSIPILLLSSKANTGEGIFANVTAVQRLDTKLGTAPTDGCSAAYVGNEAKVAYTATYYFYTGGQWPSDGGSDAGDGASDY